MLGPGNDHYDFGQTIHLTERGEAPGGGRTGPRQGRSLERVDLNKMNPNYDKSKVPCGCILTGSGSDMLSRVVKPQVLHLAFILVLMCSFTYFGLKLMSKENNESW